MAASSSKSDTRQLARWFYLIAGAVTLTAFIVAFSYLDPFAPQVIVMTTGGPGTSYEMFGHRYKEILARSGVELRLMPSAGSVENLSRLNDPNSGVDVGFVQGGLTTEKRSPGLVSLGALCYEPLWFFYRGVDPGPRLAGLRNMPVSVGPEGSGTRVLVLELLALNSIQQTDIRLLGLTQAEAGEQLASGRLSAALMLASWGSPIVRQLIANPDIELWNFSRADAYVALYPFLTRLVLPAGVGNMTDNRPPADTYLLAPKTSLVVRRDLSTPIQYLLLDAATEIHSGPEVFQRSGQFPAPEQIDLPLSGEARQFYKSGVPYLQRHLPFRLAEVIGKLLVLLIPLLGVAYPLLRVVPTLYVLNIKRRIFSLYGEVKLIEIEMETGSKESSPELLRRLDSLEERAIHMKVPFMFAQFNYALRHHIILVRERLGQHKL